MVGEYFIIKKKVNSLFKNIFSKDQLILDVGCGNNPYYHKYIKANIVCADIIKTKKTHVIGNANSLPLKKSKFDGIICVNSLYYHHNPFKSIKEFSRALKKNGKLVLIMPFVYPIHDAPDDKFRFTKYGIKELLQDDFNIKSIKTIGGIFNLSAVFFHSVIKGIPLMFPKSLRKVAMFFSTVIFYPFYFLAQLLSLFDFLDRSGRWPTYYFTIAIKKS